MKKKAKATEASLPKMDDDWQSEDDMKTLMRAEEIKADSERLKKVHKRAGRHKKALTSIQDIKDAYAAKVDESNTKLKGV